MKVFSACVLGFGVLLLSPNAICAETPTYDLVIQNAKKMANPPMQGLAKLFAAQAGWVGSESRGVMPEKAVIHYC